ncbi:hypothetical protein Pcinc_008157 [Petrolisthes cinctipes]|uniref:Uncharacterized protein n=1 Tax=Petrolisthes cinctipes TaxID=88211 RepID=A0AAE1KXJ0_PETCI|nr:hypothetical protein Pcinc_008157 [Petrolisthes cinctipes]
MGGGTEVNLLLKPLEEAVLNLGLLEMEAIEGLSDIPDIEDPDICVIGTGRQDRASTLYGYDTAWEAEVVANEADVLPSPVCMSTEDQQYGVRGNGQESFSCIPTHHSSNSASHPSSVPATPSSSPLATHQSLLEIQREILKEVRDAADSLHSIASSLNTLVAIFE